MRFRHISRSPSHTNNRGYLMLDMIIVMMLTVVIFSMTSVWMYKTIRYTTTVSQRNAHSRNISRISHQLRTDARDANTIAVEVNRLTITTASKNVIEYEITANRIHRTMSGGDKDHHDDFAFANNANLKWANEADSDSASLEIRRDFSNVSVSKTRQSRGLDARIVVQPSVEVPK